MMPRLLMGLGGGLRSAALSHMASPQQRACTQRASFAVRAAAATKRAAKKAPADADGEAASASGRSPRQMALDKTMTAINASFGKGSIMMLGSAPAVHVETFSSGALTLDLALGGGLPKGRIVEIYGPESSGKTTLALHAMAAMQKAGGAVALIDAEHAFDREYAASLGLNCDEMALCQPNSGEMALQVVDELVRSGGVDCIVVDSVAALIPQAELEGEIGLVQMGTQARMMSQALRKLPGNASKANCTIIFINQLRSKIGVIYGSPEVTTGGNALKYYSSVRLDIRRIGSVPDKPAAGEPQIGIRAKVKCVKNKVAPPYRIAEFDILFGSGISQLGCVVDAAEACGVVVRKGSWYSFRDTQLGQGREKTLAFLGENPDMAAAIEAAVRAHGQAAAPAEAAPEEDEEGVEPPAEADDEEEPAFAR